MCRMYRSVHRGVPNVFVCIGMGAHACDRHIPNVPTQTYRHIRDKMAVVAVSLVTFPDSLVTLLVEIHKYAFGDLNSLHKVKQYLLINKKRIIVRVWVHFSLRDFPPQGGAWHHRWMLKVTSCGRKCMANKREPGSAHDRRHIMTSPGYTGISRRDMQTSAPSDA